MLGFTAAVFFLLITPGPGVLSTAGVGAGFGARRGSHYVAGLFLGTNLVAMLVVSGLGALVLADPRVRTVLFAVSFCYLTYVALRIAFAGAKLAFIERVRPPGVGDGVLLQCVNPKAYAVNTALFTGFPFLPDSYLAEVVLKFVIINAIWVPVHFAWLWAGVALHRLELSERTQRVINFGMAASMLIVVVLAVVLQ
ncbi:MULTISPECIES: LysE family translocator [unclassified Shimia]|uniref:LysE family translocator n=1 Tax=unclassified Shimia TaxID=2630038 RepID=UPI003109AB22